MTRNKEHINESYLNRWIVLSCLDAIRITENKLAHLKHGLGMQCSSPLWSLHMPILCSARLAHHCLDFVMHRKLTHDYDHIADN